MSRRLTLALEKSVLSAECLKPEDLENAEKYFYSDEAIFQGCELFYFHEFECKRDDNDDEDLVWIFREEWNYERTGLHYGIVESYSTYSKNGDDFVLLRVLYSPGVIKLIRFKLSANDVVANSIINEYGYRFNLKKLLGCYIKFYVNNKTDYNGNSYSNIISFDFLTEEEYDFIRDFHCKINTIICDPSEEL